MTAIRILIGLLLGTVFSIISIVWYSSLFSSFHFSTETVQQLSELTEKRLFPIRDSRDWKNLVAAIPQKELLLLSASTKGSEEILQAQIQLTMDLIQAQRIHSLILDSDWHQIHPINLFVTSQLHHGLKSEEVLKLSTIWPEWIIYNQAFSQFIHWLRDYNLNKPQQDRVSLFGIGMNNPVHAIETLTHETESSAQLKSTLHYLKSCLNLEQESFESYAKSTAQGGRTCEEEAEDFIISINDNESFLEKYDEVHRYHLLELARLVSASEQYYQNLHTRPGQSWNAQSLYQANALLRLKKRRQENTKMTVVWGHHSVLTDTLLPSMKHAGYSNTRSLLQEHIDRSSIYVINLLALEGEILAASGIGQEPLTFKLSAPPENSIEAALKTDSLNPYFLPLFESDLSSEGLSALTIHRSISEVINNEGQLEFYSPIALPEQFDGILVFPHVSALKLLAPAKKTTH